MVLAVGSVVLATAIQAARQPQLQVLDSLWAEDGATFLTDAINRPSLPSFLTPYVGYLHVAPRLIAEIASVLPLRFAPSAMSLGATLVVSGLALYVFFASREVLPPPWARGVLSMVMVLPLSMGHETSNNSANLHWYLTFTCFWALLARPLSLAGVAVSSAIVMSAALSSPLTALFAPMALLHLWKGDDTGQRVVIFAFFVGLAVQLLGVFLGPTEVRFSDSRVLDLASLFGVSVAGSFLVGERLLDDFSGLFGWGFPVVALTLVTGLCVLGAFHSDGKRRSLIVSTFVYSLILYCVPVFIRGTRLLTSSGDVRSIGASRYSVLPVFFLATMALIIFFGGGLGGTRFWRARSGLLVVLMMLAIVNHPLENEARATGPRWSEELRTAERSCENRVREFVRVPIAPYGWVALLPCSRL